MLYNMFLKSLVLSLYCQRNRSKPFSTTGGEQKKLNYDERTTDSRDASVSDSEVSCYGKWRHVPRAYGSVGEKIGNGSCLSLQLKMAS